MTLLAWVIVVAYFGAMAWALQAILRGKDAWASRAVKSLMVAALFSVLPVWWLAEAMDGKRNEAELAARKKAAWQHFRERCNTSAKEQIHRVVSGVEGLLLLRPRERPSEADLRNQNWKGNPYWLVLYPPAEYSSYIRDLSEHDIPSTLQTTKRGYRFIERPNPSGTGFVRSYVDGATNEMAHEVSEDRKSQFAMTWENVSTEEDRKHWVAGIRLTVLEISTSEVLAEKTAYVFESGFGSIAGGRRPWLLAQSNACPPLRRNVPSDRLFVERVLVPAEAPNHGK